MALDPTLELEERSVCDVKDIHDEERQVKERGRWTGRLDFFLALCGASVGLGNVWRFPYLCYKHGGGAFLMPYLLSIFCACIPLLVLEIGIGQFTGQSAVTAWRMISPLFQGIGCAGLIIQIFLDIYYVVIMAWGVYYLFSSFHSVLPYSTCTNEWNTLCCFDTVVAHPNTTINITGAFTERNVAEYALTTLNFTEECPNGTTSPTVEFWNRKILQIHHSNGLEDIGVVGWQLFLCLALSWLLIYVCICKGVKSTSTVVYVTVPFPYLLLTILLVRAVTLPNACEGITYYLRPDVTKLRNSQVWLDAATQVLYSNSLGHGFLVALGSYNKKNYNFVRDTLLYSLTNSATSLYSGFVVFAVLGFMAGKQGVSVADVAKSGPGLGFIAYPEAITQMPLSTLWAVLFFICLIFLGIDSAFVVVEGLVTAIVDISPDIFLKGYRREVLSALCCVLLCIAGIPMVTSGGMYVFQLFDYYAASGFVLLWITIFESFVIGWVYGAKRFAQDVVDMTGMKWIMPYFFVTWGFITPLFTVAIFVFSIVGYKPLTYEGAYVYPWWGNLLGWVMALSSMVIIPVFFVYKFIFGDDGSIKQRWLALSSPRVQPANEADEKEYGYTAVEAM